MKGGILKIAIIGGGEIAGYIGDACHRLGFESHYFSMADGKVAERKVDYFHEIDIFRKEEIVEICRETGISGVLPTTELSVPVTAYVADRLGLPGNPVEVGEVLTDKYRNRECIKPLKNLFSPEYVKAESIEELCKADIPYPMIVKPVCLGGKRGVTVVGCRDELEKAFRYAASSFRPGQTPVVIAEQYIEGGTEYSVESLSYYGRHYVIQITEKDSSGSPHCVELGHHQPALLKDNMWNRVVESVSSGLTAIGLTNGPCHTEIKIVDDKIYLIEFNARPGGCHIWWPMVELSTGFDIIAAMVLMASGHPVPIDTSSFNHNFAGIYYVVSQTSYLKNIFDTCDDKPWLRIKHRVSDELKEMIRNDMDQMNYMVYSSVSGDPVAEELVGKK